MEIHTENPIWGLLNNLADKKGITEIIVNGPTQIFVERQGKFTRLSDKVTRQHINEFAQDVAKLNGKKFNADFPLLDGNLPDGSRVNIVDDSITHGSAAITIRKYLNIARSFEEQPQIFGLGQKWSLFLRALVKSNMNIMVSGGTGAGKTTLLNLLISEIPHDQRIVSIEDTFELQIHGQNCVRMETKGTNLEHSAQVTMKDLVKNALRMRPDRIMIGETRGAEIFDLFAAMNTGHDGCMTSIHANSTGDCFSRMETLFMLSGVEMPLKAIRRQIASALDFVIQLKPYKDVGRVITDIREVTGMEGDMILSQPIAERLDDGLVGTGVSPERMNFIAEKSGLIDPDFFA